jgi:hypothetical protein
MNILIRNLSLAALALAPMVSLASADPIVVRPPVCNVTNVDAFMNYLSQSKPTLGELKQIYTCLHVVMPGDIATMEYRTDNSRFFANVDEHGRIVDGSFR